MTDANFIREAVERLEHKLAINDAHLREVRSDIRALLTAFEEQDNLLAECEECLQAVFDWQETGEPSEYGAGFASAVAEISESVAPLLKKLKERNGE